jgi:hypothetical protein
MAPDLPDRNNLIDAGFSGNRLHINVPPADPSPRLSACLRVPARPPRPALRAFGRGSTRKNRLTILAQASRICTMQPSRNALVPGAFDESARVAVRAVAAPAKMRSGRRPGEKTTGYCACRSTRSTPGVDFVFPRSLTLS